MGSPRPEPPEAEGQSEVRPPLWPCFRCRCLAGSSNPKGVQSQEHLCHCCFWQPGREKEKIRSPSKYSQHGGQCCQALGSGNGMLVSYALMAPRCCSFSLYYMTKWMLNTSFLRKKTRVNTSWCWGLGSGFHMTFEKVSSIGSPIHWFSHIALVFEYWFTTFLM